MAMAFVATALSLLVPLAGATFDVAPCDATIPGYWSCTNANCSTNLYHLAWSAPPSTFNATVVESNPGWDSMTCTLDATNTSATALFYKSGNIVHRGKGQVAVGCSEIDWDDFTHWETAAPPPKLRIHLAGHSHDDVGWDQTYMQYFDGSYPPGVRYANVSQVISEVVLGLLLDPARRFSVVEQAYFQLWWEDNVALQESVRGLVARKQLVFLNGGWSMHDEANPTYIDMLDNTALGHRHIAANFGVEALPTLAWQIDPFGHSAFQGVLSSSIGGYTGVMWGREPADFKALCAANKSLERIWLPSRSLGGAAATFAAVFVDDSYATTGALERCDTEYGPTPQSCNPSFAAGDVAAVTPNILARPQSIRGSDMLVLLGDDFSWDFGRLYFNYTDALVSAFAAAGFDALYSTPADYAAAKLAALPSLPLLAGDLFPYNDDAQGHALWAGYFSSRPAFKGYVRESSAYQQAARQLQALAGFVEDLGPSNPLYALERAMGVAQHHDAISGTAKQFVDEDYRAILEAGRAGAYASVAASAATLTGYAAADFSLCPLANATLCPVLEQGGAAVALLYNPLGQPGEAGRGARLAVGFPPGVASYAVYDADARPVTAQLVPLSARDAALRALYGGDAGVPVQWLCFSPGAALPPAGFAAFFVVPANASAATPHTHASVVVTAAASSSSPPAPAPAADIVMTNGRLTLTLAAATGFLSRYADAATGVDLALSQEWLSYVGADGSAYNGSSQASGAYIFRPKSTAAAPLLPPGTAATMVTVTGPVLNETQSEYGYVSQSTRLWAGAADVEIEWTVGPVDVSDGASHEVITRYTAPALPTDGGWVTDSNCREGQPRRRGWRPQWDLKPSEPVAANYFPTNCLARTGTGTVLAVAVDRSEGGSSLADGQLEFMVHRRMTHDDGRGVGENLNEPGVDGKGLIIRGRHWLVAAPAAAAPAAYKALQQRALALPDALAAYAPLGALTPAQWLAAGYTPRASLLSRPLPANVHLATAHAHSRTALLLRLAHTYDAGEDPALSGNATVALADLFAGRTVTAAVDMTLAGAAPLAGVPQRTLHGDGGETFVVPVLPAPPAGPALTVTLAPQEIRTLMLTLAP